MGSERVPRSRVFSVVAVVLVVCVALPVSAILLIYSGDDETPPRESTLRIGFMEELDSLNPCMGLTKTSRIFYSMVYEPLVAIDENMNETGDLAISWGPVPASDAQLVLTGEPYGSVWQYNLTRNAVWHDGEPFTADDVVFTINLISGNHTVMWAFQPHSYFMDWAEKVDTYTVRIHFYNPETNEPMPVAIGGLTTIPMLPKHRLWNMTAMDIAFNWQGWFDDERTPIVGTGPFVASNTTASDWYSRDMITLERNTEFHWGLDRQWADGEPMEIQFDKVELIFFNESAALELALKKGQIDLAELPELDYRQLTDELVSGGQPADLEHYDGLTPDQSFVYLSWYLRNYTNNPSMLDPTIRKALSIAINRSGIADDILYGLADEATSLISPADAFWHYEPSVEERATYNVSRAGSILDGAGYSDIDGDGIRECTLDSYAVKQGFVQNGTELNYSISTFTYRGLAPDWAHQAADYIHSEWVRIGVQSTVVIYNPEILSLCPLELSDVALIEWGNLEPDPNTILFSQTRRAWSGWSDTWYFNPEFEEHYNRSISAMNPEERKAEVIECQRIHYLDNGYTNLVYTYQTYIWNTETFDGWGDWNAHPGLSLDNVFGPCPLFFYLKPLT